MKFDIINKVIIVKVLEKFNITPNHDSLYEKAFTHTSYANEHGTVSYERLEYLGDAVMELVISEYLYKNTEYQEGEMTKIRSYYVCANAHYEYSKKLGLNEDDLKTLKIGGLFHDIGKIGVPDAVLQKPGKLSDDEYSEIKNHPAIGAHILSTATIFTDIIPIVRHHHEKFDGTGYPSKLSGENIPYLARIAAIADTFDAMTSKRPYRDELPIDVVKEEFKKFAGTQFDPELTKVFLDILENDYNEIIRIQSMYY